MDLQTDTLSVVTLIQFSLAPVFLIVGIGQMLNVITGRLARVVDRTRWFESERPEGSSGFNARDLSEVESLRKRMRFANWAITFLTGAAVIICIDVILLLFNGLTDISLDNAILSLFILSMAFITGGLLAFFVEVTIATATLKVCFDEHTGEE